MLMATAAASLTRSTLASCDCRAPAKTARMDASTGEDVGSLSRPNGSVVGIAGAGSPARCAAEGPACRKAGEPDMVGSMSMLCGGCTGSDIVCGRDVAITPIPATGTAATEMLSGNAAIVRIELHERDRMQNVQKCRTKSKRKVQHETDSNAPKKTAKLQ